MAQEYKITSVDDEVKTWQSSFGPMLTYTLLLDETGEEIVQQNKKPDSPPPKAGDVLYGNIERNAFGAKFKTEARPQGSAAGSGGKPAWKDNSKDITLGMVWKTIAGIRGLPENKTQFTEFFLIVREHLEELLLMSEQMAKNSGQAAVPTPSVSVKEEHSNVPAAAPIHQKLAEGFTDDEIHS